MLKQRQPRQKLKEEEEELDDEDKEDTAKVDKLSEVEKNIKMLVKLLKSVVRRPKMKLQRRRSVRNRKRWNVRSSVVIQSKIVHQNY